MIRGNKTIGIYHLSVINCDVQCGEVGFFFSLLRYNSVFCIEGVKTCDKEFTSYIPTRKGICVLPELIS